MPTSPGASVADLRLPAEFAPHRATFLCWPRDAEDWGDALPEAQREFCAFARGVARHEPVRLLVRDLDEASELADAPGVQRCVVAADEAWLRDTGPTFVRRGDAVVALAWDFDGWAGRHPPSAHDRALAGALARLAGVPLERPGLVAEGGCFEADGEGTLLVTRTTLLGARNPGLDLRQAEHELASWLGARRTLWLEVELAGDDTDGHVDNAVRFVAPGRVACALASCADALRGARDARGRSLDVVDLPRPPTLEYAGRPLPASYANFYVANGSVHVPQFGTAGDADAMSVLGELFPGREVLPVPCATLLRGGGGPHCLSQPQPR